VDAALWHQGMTDEANLRRLLEEHNRWTGSKRARELLDNWDVSRAKFIKVFPVDYKRALGEMAAQKAAKAAIHAAKPATAQSSKATAATKNVAVPAK
jgi:glutamate synthase (NADPH) large chain